MPDEKKPAEVPVVESGVAKAIEALQEFGEKLRARRSAIERNAAAIARIDELLTYPVLSESEELRRLRAILTGEEVPGGD